MTERSIAEQVGEQTYARPFATLQSSTASGQRQLSRRRDEVAGRQFVEPPPAVLGEELVICRRADRGAVPQAQSVNLARAVVHPGRDSGVLCAERLVHTLHQDVVEAIE